MKYEKQALHSNIFNWTIWKDYLEHMQTSKSEK